MTFLKILFIRYHEVPMNDPGKKLMTNMRKLHYLRYKTQQDSRMAFSLRYQCYACEKGRQLRVYLRFVWSLHQVEKFLDGHNVFKSFDSQSAFFHMEPKALYRVSINKNLKCTPQKRKKDGIPLRAS